MTDKLEKKRTLQQNKALHKYLQLLADELNAAGYTFKKTMNSQGIDELQEIIDWVTNTPINPDPIRRQLKIRLSRLYGAMTFGDMDWTMIMVKNFIWRKIQITMFDKESTTELTTKEFTAIYEQISLLMAERFGIDVPLPSLESMSEAQR